MDSKILLERDKITKYIIKEPLRYDLWFKRSTIYQDLNYFHLVLSDMIHALDTSNNENIDIHLSYIFMNLNTGNYYKAVFWFNSEIIKKIKQENNLLLWFNGKKYININDKIEILNKIKKEIKELNEIQKNREIIIKLPIQDYPWLYNFDILKLYNKDEIINETLKLCNKENIKNILNLSYDEIHGRYWKSKLKINKGKIIIISKPAMSVHNYINMDLCEHCCSDLDIIKSKIICNKCKLKYCSNECYNESLNQYHELLCNKKTELKKIYDIVKNGVSATSLIPLYILKIFSIAKYKNIHPSSIDFIKCLSRNPYICDKKYDNENYYMLFNHVQIDLWNIIIEILECKNDINFDFDVYMFISTKLINNIFKINSKYGLGSKLYTTLSFLNHDCNPNAYIDIDSNSLIAQKNIHENDNINISYICDYDERKTLLYNWGIICKCKKCLSRKK